MPNFPTSAIVLVEDQEQQNLIRRFLEARGQGWARYAPLPNGQGSGEQYVRQQFPRELENLRARMPRAQTILIVMTDADRLTTAQRRSQLAGALPGEPVVILIPKRHVETWLGALNGHAVNEDDDYHGQFSSTREINAAARALYASSRPNQPQPANCAHLPSLLDSLPEWSRI
ncbi:MAG: hypothetical protein ACRD1L_07495 [Terriglobales bacterium]